EQITLRAATFLRLERESQEKNLRADQLRAQIIEKIQRLQQLPFFERQGAEAKKLREEIKGLEGDLRGLVGKFSSLFSELPKFETIQNLSASGLLEEQLKTQIELGKQRLEQRKDEKKAQEELNRATAELEARAPKPFTIPRSISQLTEKETRSFIVQTEELIKKRKELSDLQAKQAREIPSDTQKRTKEQTQAVEELKRQIEKLPPIRVAGEAFGSFQKIDDATRLLDKLIDRERHFTELHRREADAKAQNKAATESLRNAEQRLLEVRALRTGGEAARDVLRQIKLESDLTKAIEKQKLAQEELNNAIRFTPRDKIKKDTREGELKAANEKVVEARIALDTFEIAQDEKRKQRREQLIDRLRRLEEQLIDTQDFIARETERLDGDTIEARRARIDGFINERLRKEQFIQRKLEELQLEKELPAEQKREIEIRLQNMPETLRQLEELRKRLHQVSDAQVRMRDTERTLSNQTADLNLALELLRGKFERGEISSNQYRKAVASIRDKQIETLKAGRDAATIEVALALARKAGREELQQLIDKVLEYERAIKAATSAQQTEIKSRQTRSIFDFGRQRDREEPLGLDIASITDEILSTINSLISAFQQSITAGIGQVLQVVGQAIGGLVGGIISAIGQVISFIDQFIGRAARKLAETIRKEIQGIQRSLRFDDITLSGAIQQLEAERERAIRELSRKKRGRKELQRLLPEIDQEIDSLRLRQRDILSRFDRDLETLRLAPNLQDIGRSFQELTDKIKEFLGAGGDAAKAIEFLSLSVGQTRTRLNEELAELDKDATRTRQQATEDAADAEKKFQEQLRKEIDRFLRGAEDDAGRLISLEQKAALDITKAEAQFFERRKKRTEDIRKAEEDIQKSIVDEQKNINNILNEGIAIRQKSTVQSKNERIAEIQNEASARREELRRRISEIQREDQEQQIAHDNELQRIGNRLERERQAHEERLRELKEEFDERKRRREKDLAEFEEEHARRVGRLREQLAFLNEMEERTRRIFGESTGGAAGGGGGAGAGGTDQDRREDRDRSREQLDVSKTSVTRLEEQV
ncbi:MAG: hypothetical protein AAB456_04235, partial [Patescibacteria group bacterium]